MPSSHCEWHSQNAVLMAFYFPLEVIIQFYRLIIWPFILGLSIAVLTGSQLKEGNTTETFQISIALGELSVWFHNWKADERSSKWQRRLEEFRSCLLANAGKRRIDKWMNGFWCRYNYQIIQIHLYLSLSSSFFVIWFVCWFFLSFFFKETCGTLFWSLLKLVWVYFIGPTPHLQCGSKAFLATQE